MIQEMLCGHLFDCKKIVTCTTRQPREGESDKDYHFMSEVEFSERRARNEFVESDCYGGAWYGMLRLSLDDPDHTLVAVMTPSGAKAVKDACPDAFVVHVKTSMKTAVMRAIEREKELMPDAMIAISARACTDDQMFRDVPCDFEIVNETEDSGFALAKAILEAHEKYLSGLS